MLLIYFQHLLMHTNVRSHGSISRLKFWLKPREQWRLERTVGAEFHTRAAFKEQTWMTDHCKWMHYLPFPPKEGSDRFTHSCKYNVYDRPKNECLADICLVSDNWIKPRFVFWNPNVLKPGWLHFMDERVRSVADKLSSGASGAQTSLQAFLHRPRE